MIGFEALGTFTNTLTLFGLYLNNSSVLPGAALIVSATAVEMSTSNSGGGQLVGSLFTPVVGAYYTCAAVFNPSGSILYIYSPGLATQVITASWTAAAPVYTGTSNIGFNGGGGKSNFKLNIQTFFAGVYSRGLSANEAAAWGRNPWQIFAPSQSIALTTPTPGITISPTSIYASHPAGQTLTLSTVGTAYTPGTPGSPTFTGSGVAGATIASQVISSSSGPHAASVVVDTSTGTGTLTISDGTYSSSVNVVAPSFTISPTTIPANHAGNITLTLTGVGTLWSSNTFTLSGVSGVTKVSQTINSNTSVTLVATTGSGTGTLTVSDGTYAATTTIATSSFTLSVTQGNYEVPYSITATGTPARSGPGRPRRRSSRHRESLAIRSRRSR